MSSVAQTIMAAIGTKLAASIPALSGKINYDYWHDPVMIEPEGLPYANILYTGESEAMTSNQLGGLVIVQGELQIDYFVELTSMDSPSMTDRAIGLDALADIRQAVHELVYNHAIGSVPLAGIGFLDLQSLTATIATVRTLATPHVVVTVKPEIRFERAYNQR